MTAEEFANNKLGDKNYTHSPYPMHRELLIEWLEQYGKEQFGAGRESVLEAHAHLTQEAYREGAKAQREADVLILDSMSPLRSYHLRSAPLVTQEEDDSNSN